MTTPYQIYEKNGEYFSYDGITKERPFLPRFGLKVKWSWSDLWSEVETLNKSNSREIYKVIFLARHASGTNTLPDSGEANQQDAVPKRDSPLVQQGYIQASNVQALWRAEQGEGLGIPNISYCSPAMRALVTNSITFAPLLAAKSEMKTYVYENCRENLIGNWNKEDYPQHSDDNGTDHRLSKDAIHEMFPDFDVDLTRLAELDPLWLRKIDKTKSEATESNQATQILDRIFKSEANSKRFVSITGHGAINDAILDAVGFLDSTTIEPSSVTHHGGVLAFICQYTPDSDNKQLQNGLYKIQYANKPKEPNLFAYSDGKDGGNIVTECVTKKTPSTWNVNLVDSDSDTYTIQLQDTTYYWNQKADDEDDKDEYVALGDTAFSWQLNQDQEAGVYTIQVPPTSSSSTQESKDDNDTDTDDSAEYVGKTDDGELISFSSESGTKWNFIPAWAASTW